MRRDANRSHADLRLWSRPYPRPPNDGLRLYAILPRARNHVDMAKVRCGRYVLLFAPADAVCRSRRSALLWMRTNNAVDIWSTGCIFAEMLEGKPLFPGKDHVNQFSIITELLGTPPDDVIQTIASENVSTT